MHAIRSSFTVWAFTFSPVTLQRCADQVTLNNKMTIKTAVIIKPSVCEVSPEGSAFIYYSVFVLVVSWRRYSFRGSEIWLCKYDVWLFVVSVVCMYFPSACWSHGTCTFCESLVTLFTLSFLDCMCTTSSFWSGKWKLLGNELLLGSFNRSLENDSRQMKSKVSHLNDL